jgi:hypothetical protein
MGRVIIFVLIGALLVGLWARSAFREKRRQEAQKPEINKHPERLDQMLDPTDDA